MSNWFSNLLKKRNTPSNYDWWVTNVLKMERDEVSVTPVSALGVTAVYAAVKMISGTISSVPFNTYEKTNIGRELAKGHDQYFLLKKEPNKLYSSTGFRQTLIASYLLKGNGYAEIKRNRYDRPIRYILINPDVVEVEWSEDGASIRYVIEEFKGRKRTIPQRDMIHISDMNLDGVQGMSKIALAADTISLNLYGTKFSNNFYKNGSHLGGWLEFQGILKDEDMKKLRTTWKSVNGGLNNTGEVAVLDKATKYHTHQISMPFSDMEFIESQKFNISDIARIFNIPNHKINDLTKSAFTNIEHQSKEFVENCILPIAVLVEQEFDRKVFKSSERNSHYVKLELKGLLRGDIEAQTTFITAMIDRGIFSINEAREYNDLNPIEGGDVRLVPLNFTTLDKALSDEEPIPTPLQPGSTDKSGNDK